MNIRYVSLVAAAVLSAASAHAQLNRAYVSVANGNDTNACSYASPCRTIGKAVSVLNSGGEAILIDGGGFGPFNIDRGVSIQAPQSVFAGVIAASGSAITVDTTGTVILRGLTLTGVGASTGLDVEEAGGVHIEDVVANGFTDSAIRTELVPEVFVRRATARHSGSGFAFINFGWGIETAVTISDSTADANQVGIAAGGVSLSLLVRNSTLAGNSGSGLDTYQAGTVVVERSTFSGNGTGISCQQADSRVDVSDSSFFFNDRGVQPFNGGSIYSRGNNRYAENTFSTTWTGTFSATGAGEAVE